VRGELLVCVSLARLLGIGTENSGRSGAAHLGGRLLVIQDAGSRIVFPVDEVHGVQRFEPAQLKPVPATVAKGTATYTRAMLVLQDKVIGCLDEQLLFYTLNRGFE
jgi:chemotaxis-related protein WspD